MADQLSAWGDAPAAAPEAPQASTAPASGWGDEQAAPLAGSIKYGSRVPPEQAAKVLDLQSKTGLPDTLIQRNLEEVDNHVKAAQVDPVQIQKQSPSLASWLAENYLHYAIAGPDLYNLHSIEGLAKDVGAGAYRGSLEIQRSAIGLKGLFGVGAPEDAQKVSDIERRMAAAQSSEAPSIYGTLAENAPIMAGATAATGAAALLGGAGVGAAGVATAASIARGALFGASTAGSAYLDYQKLRDEKGQPLDPSLTRGAALTTGVINSILQEKVFANIAEKTPAFQSLMPQGMKSMLQSPTLRAAISNYLLKIGEQAGAQGGVQWITSMAKSGGGELAKMISDGRINQTSPGEILSTIFNPEAVKEAAKSVKSGMVVGGAMATGFGIYDFAKNYTDIIHATDAARSYEDMGNKIQGLKMLEHSPEKTQEVIKRITGGPDGDGPNRNTYIPIRDFNEHYQGKEIDPREAFRAITGSYAGYDEASRTGSDLQIPTEKYLTTIGVVPEDNKKFSQVIRTDPAAMNAQEAQKASELIKQERKEVSPEDKIKNEIVKIPEPLPTPETEPITPAPGAQKPVEQAAVDLIHERQGFEPLFKDPARILPQGEAERYNKAIEDVRARAQEEVAGKIVDRKLREKSKAWNNERDAIKETVQDDSWQHKEFLAKEILSEPLHTKERAEAIRQEEMTAYEAKKQEYDAWRDLLKSGIKPSPDVADELKTLPLWMRKNDGRGYDEFAQEAREKGLLGVNQDFFEKARSIRAPKKPQAVEDYVPQVLREIGAVKLDKAAIKRDFPETDLSKLRGMTIDEGGLHPDQLAEQLGFSSGARLLYDLQSTPKRSDWVEEETDRRMLERHPDITAGPNIVEAAMTAAHSTHRSRLLITELRLLATEHMAAMKGMIRRITRPIPTLAKERLDAQRDIGTKPIADIKPTMYSQAEARDSREAGIHFSNGDVEKAFESKYRELLNHERFRAATEGQEYIQKALDYIQRLNKDAARDRITKASGGAVDYIGQIDDILDRFDFRKSVTGKALGKRQSLREFVQSAQNEGYSPSIPEDVLSDANRRHYKELPLDQFKDVIQSLKSIQQLAELKGELLANAREKSFDAAKNKIIAEINENHDVKIGPPKPRTTNETNIAKAFLSAQTRLEFLFDRLAGYKPLSDTYQMLFKPTVDAQNSEREMLIDKMYKMGDLSLDKIFSAYPTTERAMWYYRKTYIPEIESDMLKPNILMAALNLGNTYNREALKEGYKWSDEQLKAVTDHLDAKDWATVQKIWDHLETYRPDVGKLEKKLNGQEPEWVDAEPFDITTKDGKTISLRGGYFPIMFDPKLSPELARVDEKAQAIDLFGGQYAQAMTKHGHTIARVGTGGKPLLLQLSGLTNHIQNVIHDLTWRETIIDLNRLINDQDIRVNIRGAVGEENYALLNPWLRSIAGERSGNALNPYEQLLGRARGMATDVRLGFSVTAGLKHLTNYGMAVNELGIPYATKGLLSVYGKPWNIAKQWNMVKEASKQMAGFDETYDRDVRDMFKGMNIAGTREGLTALPEKASAALSVVDAYTHDMQKAFFWHFGFMYRGVALPAWIGAYQKAMDGELENVKAGDRDKAIDYADHVVRTTIAAASVKDLPNIMNKPGPAKLFTMYYGPMNIVFNNIQKETHQFSKESIPKLIGAATFLWFGSAAIQNVITGKSPGADDDMETWLKFLAKSSLHFGAEQFIGLRDAARLVETGGRDFSLSPVGDVLAGITKATMAATQRASGQKEQLSHSDIKNLVDTAGYFTGMPTGQMFKTLDYILDWITGNVQPENPMEGAWRALVGRRTT